MGFRAVCFDSSGQSVVCALLLLEFPSVEALMASKESSGFAGRSDELGSTDVAEDLHDGLVDVGPVRRDSPFDDLSHMLLSERVPWTLLLLALFFVVAHVFTSG